MKKSINKTLDLQFPSEENLDSVIEEFIAREEFYCTDNDKPLFCDMYNF
jgi:hypothetical protein